MVAITLGKKTFLTKTAAKDWVSKQILHGNNLGDAITDTEQIEVLDDLLSRKDSYKEKVGPGVQFYFVDRKSKYDSNVRKTDLTLAIRHVDDEAGETDVDFGYGKVIEGATAKSDVSDALRNEAVAKRDAFKFGSFSKGKTPICTSTGVPIASEGDAEVRYANPSWDELITGFADAEGGFSSIATHSGHGGPQVGRRLTSDEVRERWLAYWDSHAKPELHAKVK